MKLNRIISALVIGLVIGHSAFVIPTLQAADISVTASGVVMSSAGLFKTKNAGASETITAGQSIYYDANTDTVKRAKSTTLGTAIISNNGGGGIALNGGSAGQPITYCYYDPSFTVGGTVGSGQTVYLSALNAGGISLTVPATTETNVVMGIGIGANKMFLNPTQGGAVP